MPPAMLDPYCGPAPDPSTLLGRWNFDPPLMAGLALLAFFLVAARRGGARDLAAFAGWSLLVVAFVSPLCALASALFSARVLHHVLLVAGAAPLLAAALPVRLGSAPQLAFAVHTLLFWLWHSPAAYAFALTSDAPYWLMQATLLGSAVWLWRALIAQRCPAGTALALLLGTVLQMGMLAALLTFSRAPLYEAHFTTTAAFGLTPLEDQQLAGALMWVPAALPYLLAALLRVRTLLQDRPAEGRGAS